MSTGSHLQDPYRKACRKVVSWPTCCTGGSVVCGAVLERLSSVLVSLIYRLVDACRHAQTECRQLSLALQLLSWARTAQVPYIRLLRKTAALHMHMAACAARAMGLSVVLK